MRTMAALLVAAGSTVVLTSIESRALTPVRESLAAGVAALGPWGGYSNGEIPLSALTRVDDPGVQLDPFPGSLPALYLKPDAAAALRALLSEYHRQTGDRLHPSEGYRSYAGQVYWRDYYTRQGTPEKAAPPGTSNHGWGQAVDFKLDASQSAWLASNAHRFGYVRSTTDSVHFDYVAGGSGSTRSCGSLTTTTTESDGIPGPNYWKLFQCFAAKRGGYTGPIDGFPGFYAYTAFQRAARSFGYTGSLDGKFSPAGASSVTLALQKVAAAHGYNGPQDGVIGPNTYRRSAAYFNYLWLNHGLD